MQRKIKHNLPSAYIRIKYENHIIDSFRFFSRYFLKLNTTKYESIKFNKKKSSKNNNQTTTTGVKVFLRYVDDIVRTVKGDPGVLLEAANKLHPNLQFTIEELDSNGNLAFLDLVVNGTQETRSHVGGTKNPLIPAPFQFLEVAQLCSTKATLLKGWFMGFSELPQHGKILTRHWKKIGNNGLKINIRKIGRTG